MKNTFVIPLAVAFLAEFVGAIGAVLSVIGMLTVLGTDHMTVALWAYFAHLCRCVVLVGVGVAIQVLIVIAERR